MKMYKQPDWQYVTSGVEGDVTLFGVNIFDYKWESTGKRAKVKDPSYKQDFVFNVYKVTIDGTEHEFAAGEFSNCVYGFYLMNY